VKPIRILLIAVPPLVGDVLRSAAAPDVSIVGDISATEALVAHVDRTDANVVLYGADDSGLPARCRQLLDSRVGVKVTVISMDARRATLYELRPHRELLGEVAPDGLLDALRTALARADAAW
jgi:DNA-binding NarL/FixJ family response regulator